MGSWSGGQVVLPDRPAAQAQNLRRAQGQRIAPRATGLVQAIRHLGVGMQAHPGALGHPECSQ